MSVSVAGPILSRAPTPEIGPESVAFASASTTPVVCRRMSLAEDRGASNSSAPPPQRLAETVQLAKVIPPCGAPRLASDAIAVTPPSI